MSVIGVGAAENPRKIQWSVGKEILVAMVLTIPATMILSFILSSLFLASTGGKL
jgi:PiT family inorganic phosphate transporter